MLNHSEWNESGTNFRSTQSMISFIFYSFSLMPPFTIHPVIHTIKNENTHERNNPGIPSHNTEG